MILPRRAALASVTILTIACAGFALRGWAEEAGLDVWNLPRLEADLAGHRQEHEALQRRHAVVLQSLPARRQAILEVIAEERSLAEAAEVFLELNHAHPAIERTWRHLLPEATTDAEASRLHVLHYVQHELSHQPDLQARVLARLRAELDHWRAAREAHGPKPSPTEPAAVPARTK